MKAINHTPVILDTGKISYLLDHHSQPLETTADLDLLMDSIGNARYVLLGEASHGTHEYYTWRIKITQRLLAEKNFSLVAVEGDWPDCYRLNRYVKGYPGSGESATEVLHAFNRWPTWMWANWEIVAFTEWLRKFNKGRSPERRAGFYGLDVYSLWESLEAILEYLEKTDPVALAAAKSALKCFEPYGYDEGHSYARASLLVPELCQQEVIRMLTSIRQNIASYNSDYENVFSAEQNAWVAVNAEKYYRAMVRGGALSWNIRDMHMTETLERLMKFHGSGAKAVIWEHNTHIGDARATDMATDGMINIGQLIRERHASAGVVLVGFGSYEGSVIAGREWGDIMRKMTVPAAQPGSWENIFHQAAEGTDKLLMMDRIKYEEVVATPIGHRAIGVVYNPEYEKYGNYVPSIIPLRYDAFVFLDKTRALHPLHIQPDGHQIPETFPFGV